MLFNIKYCSITLICGLLLACQPENKSSKSTEGPLLELKPVERGGKTEVTVLGLIHSGHRDSKNFPLSKISKTLQQIKPDIILTEIPASRIDAAIRSYKETGQVTESRTRAFPEYTDVIIPLQQKMGYKLAGTAAWSAQIAAKRQQTLSKFSKDLARKHEWQAWEDAQADFRAKLNGRGDDPGYIHSPAYDLAVEARYKPYIRYFDKDIGNGGWVAINQAHWNNISAELNAISGDGQRVLITYGAFHKYLILRALKKRNDVIITPASRYFE